MFRHRTFEYLCDLYSRLEETGAIPYDQTVQDRVVGVLGTSRKAADANNVRRGVIEVTTELTTQRDTGHFIARSFGGGLDLNLFSQERNLNRGWSQQGKIYRQMEQYCRAQVGTFCFSRPIYADGSCVPRWLEFGVLVANGEIWVEVFDN